jgi:two-component system nitrate/nitrite response regulator NarL
MTKSFIVCDDHPLINQAISQFFENKNFACAGQFNSNKELRHFFNSNHIELLICDLNIDQEDTLDVLRFIKNQHPNLFIVIFSAYSDRIYIEKAKKIGVNLYISKTTELEKLFEYIVNFQGTFYCNSSIFGNTDEENFIDANPENSKQIKISDQEKKIISLVLAGKTSENISKELFISKYTVDTHRKNINKKLKVSGIVQLQEKINQLKIL